MRECGLRAFAPLLSLHAVAAKKKTKTKRKRKFNIKKT